jgi:hypothetical protein
MFQTFIVPSQNSLEILHKPRAPLSTTQEDEGRGRSPYRRSSTSGVGVWPKRRESARRLNRKDARSGRTQYGHA